MQLDFNKQLAKQTLKLSGRDLERVLAATLSTLNYFVLRNIIFSRDYEDIGEIDVFASLQTPFHESRILFECKGSPPTYNEIKQFSTLRNILSPPPDESIIISKKGHFNNKISIANKLNVQILNKKEIVKFILPLLGVDTKERQTRVSYLNKALACFVAQDYLAKLTGQYNDLKDHFCYLTRYLWSIEDPFDQKEESFDKAKNQYKDTTNKIAQQLNIDLNNELNNAINDFIQSAMYVECLHRIINMYAVVRCATEIQRKLSQKDLIEKMGKYLQSSINIITRNPVYIYGFPAFFQFWLFMWGGFMIKSEYENEVNMLAKECSITKEAVELYLEVIKNTYSSPEGGSLLLSWDHIEFFKYVPAAFRAIGRRYRISLDSNKYQQMQMFFNDQNYDLALNRALNEAGGTSALKWS